MKHLKNTKNKKEPEVEPEYIILDERVRVFAGLKEGHHIFSENIDEAKPLQGQSKFTYMQRCLPYSKLEQMFLNGREKGINRKTKVSI